jgi:ATP-dependent phosphofructokinase / diphosphate-dependent phosphofructokinase
MENTIQRIGILTGGGDCPGLNAVIRAVVKTAINEYGWEVIGIEDGFEGLIWPGRTRVLTADDVRGILPRGGTILGTTNRSNPFQFQAVSTAAAEPLDLSLQVIQRVQDLGLDAVIVIGGDGTLRIAAELMKKGLRVVCVPKTIDNDLEQTDITFGFDTALNTAVEALDRLHTTAESHHRIMVLEVMGRDAGWIALEAGIAGGADVILIPEIPYELDAIAEKISRRNFRGAKFSLIVAAEGARPVGGDAVFFAKPDPGGQPRLGGIGQVLAGQLQDRFGFDVRVTVLGHLQRGGSPSAFDRLLSSRFGTKAVHLAAQQRFGYMVALHGEQIHAVEINEAIRKQKMVPLDSDIILTALGLDISLGNYREAIHASKAGGI